MKWLNWRECEINKKKTLLKAEDLNKIPDGLKLAFPYGLTSQHYKASEPSRAMYEHADSTQKSYKEFIGLRFRSSTAGTVISEKLIKQFIQKNSEFYVSLEDGPVLIKNKNFIIIASPEPVKELITYLPAQ
jgi:hypothetical protein